MTRVQPPGALVVAAPALVLAAGDKQGGPGAGPVDHVDGVVLVIVHLFFVNYRKDYFTWEKFIELVIPAMNFLCVN